MRRIGLLSCALASSALLAACGSSSSGGSSAFSSTPPSTSSSTSSFDKAAATQAAQGALLTLSDFPAKWTSSPADNSDNQQLDTDLANCLGVSADSFGDPGANGATADSPDFAPPGSSNATVSETIDVAASSSDMDQRMNVVESSKLPGCLDSVMGSFLKAQFAKDPNTRSATLGTPVTKTLDFMKLGDAMAAYSLTIPFSVQGQQVSFYGDLVFIRTSATTGVELSYFDIASPFDLSTAESIAQTAVSKVSAANLPS